MKKFLSAIVLTLCLVATHKIVAQVTWENLKGPYGGIIFDLEFTTSGDKYYALVSEYNGTYLYGDLFESIDNGATWHLVNFSPTKEYATDVEVDDTGVYIVTGSNVYKSTDNGATYTKLNSSPLDEIFRIKRNPVTGTLIGASHFKLYRSTNGGSTWTLGYNLSPGGGAGSFLDLEVNAAGHFFVSGGVGLVRSSDDGFSAVSVTTGLSDGQVMEIEVSKDGNTLFAHHRQGVQQAIDPVGVQLMGDVWTNPTGLLASPGSSWDSHGVLAATDDGNIIFADDYNNKVYSKTTAGAAWTEKGNLAVRPRSASARNVNSFFVGTNHGVFSTSNGGTSFGMSNDGIERLRSNSMILTTDGRVVVSTGSKFHVGQNLFASSPSWQNFYFNEYQHTPDLFAMSDGSVLALGSTGLRSNTTVSSWPTTYTTPSNTYNYTQASATAFYGVSNDGKIFYSNNTGATWNTGANISISGLPASYQVMKLANSGTNNKLFLTLRNYSNNDVELYRITLTGVPPAAPTAAAAAIVSTGGFPGYTVNEVDDTKTVGNTIYVLGPGTSGHRVARSTDGGATWSTANAPGGNKLAVTANGYIFVLQYGTFSVSRDNGVSFTSYTFNTSSDFFDLAGLDLDSEGRAFLLQNNTGGLFYTNETMVLPADPTAFELAGRSSNEIMLRWTDNSQNEWRYIIERETLGVYDSIGYQGGVYLSGKKGYFRDTNLQPGTSYNYRVRARNSAGYSSYATVTVSTTNTCASAIPDNRSWAATFIEGGGTPVANAQVVSMGNGEYYVNNVDLGLYSSQVGYFYESCGETYLYSTQGSGTNLAPNTNGAWNGTNTITVKWVTDDSNPEVAKTLRLILNANDPTPASPSGVSASIFNNTTMEVRWVGSAFETQYVVERSSTSGSGFVEIATVNYPTKFYMDNTVALNTNYYYRIKARNTTGTSAASAESTVVNFKQPNFILATNGVTAATGNTSGTIWGDIDNDGDEDLILLPFDFFSANLNTPATFRNDGGGNFTAVDPGFEPSNYAAGTIADYDNDGNLDIYFTVFNDENKLYKGAGNFSFTKITGTPLTVAAGDIDDSSFSPMWVDYTNDGRLDLLIVYEDNVNLLFKQNSDGTFTQESTGEIATNRFFGLDATWVDFDNDGDMDVFFVNGYDGNTNTDYPCLLYRNNGNGTFTNLGAIGFDPSSNTNSPISAAWGDYNNDGFLDVFVANQDAELTSTNYLYKNNGNGTFTKQAASAIMEPQTAATFGGVWGDINNDGLLDLLTAKSGKNVIYLNQGATFAKVTAEKFNDPFSTNLGVSLADYNKDGLLDAALGHVDPSLFTENGLQSSAIVNNLLFVNNNTPGNWIEIKLKATVSNRSAIGARVIVRTGVSTYQYRQVLGHSSFVSQNSSILHFGLGASTSVASIEVRWPSGIVQTLSNIASNSIIEITEDNTPPALTLGPVNGASSVSTNTTLTITTNEVSSAVATKLVSVFRADETAALFTLDVATASKSGNVYTFTLPQKLALNTIYKISVDAGAFADIYGNASLAVAKDAWTFTTTNGPTISTYSPAFLATNVNTTTSLAITFDQPVTAVATKALKIFDTTAPSTAIATLAVDAATVSANTLTFTLPAKLNLQKSYFVTIDAGAFKDADQNDYAGLAASVWQFTTTAGPQATTLLPANGATAVLVTANLEITFDKAITAVAGKNIKILDGATTLTDVPVATTGTVSGTKYTLTHATPFPGDKLLTIAMDAGAFVDANGNDFAGIGGTSWQFTTEDKTPPVITFTAPTSLTKGFATATFGATVTDNKDVSLVRVHHKKITAATFTTVDLAESATADVYNASVSEAMLDAIGIEYFFTARDANNNETRSPAGAATYKTRINYTEDATKIPTLGFGGLKNSWKIFSIPFELGSNNSVTSIFDELSSLTNKVDYRIIKYKDEANWGEYPADFSNITRGEGYFINIKEALDIAVGDNLVAPANDRNSLFTINLKQGWNQIGNPYLTQISWSDVAAYNGLTGTAATLKKFSNGAYANQNDLAPFEGGFVFVSTAVNNVSIPFLGQTGSGARTNSGMMWELPLHVSQGDIKNEFGGIGMAEQAAISFDDFDDVNPPHIGDFVEINFQHPEHFARFFAKDVVPVSEEYSWNFKVRASQEGNTTITWSKELVETLAGELYLTSDQMLFPIDMRKVDTYVIPAGVEPSSFKIYYGKNIGSDLMPFAAVADAAYPNPTNGLLTIPLALPEKGGEQQRVRVELLNTVGGSLGIQMEGVYSSGFHELKLDAGARVSTDGLVVYKISVENAQGNSVLQGKVMVKK